MGQTKGETRALLRINYIVRWNVNAPPPFSESFDSRAQFLAVGFHNHSGLRSAVGEDALDSGADRHGWKQHADGARTLQKKNRPHWRKRKYKISIF